MYVKMCTSCSQSRRASGCVLDQLGVVVGIHISENTFGLGGGIRAKFCRIIKSIWICKYARYHVCAFVYLSVHEV